MSRGLYSLLIRCAAPIAFAVVLWRGVRDRGYWQGLGERFALGAPAGGSPTLWVHAVSLGEVSAAAPLVRALRAKYRELPLVLTTATPTGRARAQALFGGDVEVRFLPYDTPGAVARFLSRIRPRLAVIMETELWPNLFEECRRRQVPLLLASARLSDRSVRNYQRCGALFRGIFSDKVWAAAQTAEDAERFIAIGAAASRTPVIGNIKFDIELGAGVAAEGKLLRLAFGDGRAVWIAGSTHAGEEELLLAAHEAVSRERPDALLLLVPRHPARFAAVAELLGRRGARFVRRSGMRDGAGGPRSGGVSDGSVDASGEHDVGRGGSAGGVGRGVSRGGGSGSSLTGGAVDETTQVLLVDTVGELASLYAAADVAFVGGSLVPVGGHNLLEPAALGVPVLTGPYYANGREIAELLLARGAAVKVADARELTQALRRLFADPQERRRMGAAGVRIVESNRGSVARLLELIATLLAPPPGRASGSGPSPAPGPGAPLPSTER